MKYFPRVLKYLFAYWSLAVLTVVLIVLATIIGLAVPWPMKFLVDSVLESSHPQPIPAFLQRIFGSDHRRSLMYFAIFSHLGIVLLDDLVSVLNNYVQTKLEQKMTLDFRGDLFNHALNMSIAYHDQKRSGMLIYIINSIGSSVVSFIMTIPHLARSIATLIGMFCISLVIDWKLALLSMTVVPFLYYSVGYYATHIQARLREVKGLEGESLSIIHEAVSMIRVILAFGRQDHEFGRFKVQGEKAIKARVNITVRQTLFTMAVNATTAVGTVLVLGVGASHVLSGILSVGSLLVVLQYLKQVYKPLEDISYTIGELQDKFVNLQVAYGLLDSKPDIIDPPIATDVVRCKGDIKFDDVAFSYSGRVDTLKRISFEAKAGQVIAIVGPTGAGKSTMVSMIPRFYDPQDGQILLDGVDIKSFKLRDLRSQVSIVLQEPLLFSGTIEDNIRYGRLEATDEQVVEAAKAANAHDFIMRLPLQYKTELGERGAQVSGGERQRISVARAFLKGAPILILDEPTSAIDSKTEAVILDALDRLMVGRTTFMIAHRLSTVRRADMILVMDQGQIVESGTHVELIAKDGLYAQLHRIQSGAGHAVHPEVAAAVVGN